jgi:hypothetical protein
MEPGQFSHGRPDRQCFPDNAVQEAISYAVPMPSPYVSPIKEKVHRLYSLCALYKLIYVYMVFI